MTRRAEAVGAIRVPSGRGRGEIVEKGSRFLAVAAPAADEESARSLRDELRARHHDATHHVLAVRLDEERVRWDDAGEPAGTAGRPVLDALRRAGLWRTAVVVVRWFGGTELGTGGLARAYGAAADAALADLPTRACVPGRRLRVRFPYGDTGAVMRLVSARRARRRRVEYGEEAELILDVPGDEVEAFLRELRDATAGRAGAEVVAREILVPAGASEEPSG